ncbi:MAG: DUF2484 family protein [Gemmobacter sp.]|nr:DUF2484 family protein [Gemmobacter sp.]
MVLTGAAVMVWLMAGLAACTLLPPRARILRLALVVAGVPLLGLVTLQLGPWAGLAGLGSGTLVLALHRLPRILPRTRLE